MAVLNCPVAGIGATSSTTDTIEISHSSIDEAKAGERTEIDVKVTDQSGVYDVRVYFKAFEAAEYSYVVLASENGKDFSTVLPAPANGSGSFDYLILVFKREEQGLQDPDLYRNCRQ